MTTTERDTAAGVFEDRAQAEKAVKELRRAGFRQDQIGLALLSDNPHLDADKADAATEGAVAGALTGGAFGALLGGLAVGMIPGVGWVIAGGLLAGIAGGAAVGTTAGGLLGALVAMDISEDEARFYEAEVRAGRTLVTVKADGRSAEADTILRRHGGVRCEDTDLRPAGGP